jgi:hypothetical protein
MARVENYHLWFLCVRPLYLLLGVSGFLTGLIRVQRSPVGPPGLCAWFLGPQISHERELIAVSCFVGSQWALHFAKPDEYTLVFVCT